MSFLRQNRLAILVWVLSAIGLFRPLAVHAARSVRVLCVEYDGRRHIESADAGSPGDCLVRGPSATERDVLPSSMRPTVPGSCARCVDLSLSHLDKDRPLATRGERAWSADPPPWSHGDRQPGAVVVDRRLSPRSVREDPVHRPSWDISSTVLLI